jgi:hypothetical protein
VSKVDLRPQCGMPCSKLEVSTAQHGTLSGAAICTRAVMFAIAAIYAPTTADLDVEWPLQTAAVELALGRRPAYGRQKRRPPAAQSRSASLPMGHQPQPMFRRPLACGAASGVGGSAPA